MPLPSTIRGGCQWPKFGGTNDPRSLGGEGRRGIWPKIISEFGPKLTIIARTFMYKNHKFHIFFKNNSMIHTIFNRKDQEKKLISFAQIIREGGSASGH